MALDPSYIVRVREQVSLDTTATRDFSKTLFLHTPPTSTSAPELRRHGQISSYSSLEDLAQEWSTTSAPYTAASVYFQQVPYPGQFAVASYFATARAGRIEGSSIATSQADVRAFGATAPMNLFGVAVTANMSAITNPASVATALQTGINAQANITGVTVTATGTDIAASQSYTITIPAALAQLAALDVNQGITGPLADHLGLSEVSDGVYARPFAQDTSVTDALNRAEEADGTFYFFVLASALESAAANITAASAWAETRTHIFGFESSDEGSLNATNSTAPIVLVNTARRARTFGIFTRNPDGKAVSVCARFSSINYDSPGSNINLAHKSLPGTQPDTLTQAQMDILDSRGASAYATIAGSSRILFGRSANGSYVDARVWTDWLVDRLQAGVINLLGASGRIPLSARGSAQLLSSAIEVCNRGQANGGFTPGQLSPALVGSVRSITGNDGFTGNLSNGYFAYIAPQDLADENNRVAPPIYVWGIYRGGVNRVNIDLAIGA